MKVAVNGNPLIGLYAKASEEYAVVGVNHEPPTKIRVRAVKFDDGIVEVELA